MKYMKLTQVYLRLYHALHAISSIAEASLTQRERLLLNIKYDHTVLQQWATDDPPIPPPPPGPYRYQISVYQAVCLLNSPNSNT